MREYSAPLDVEVPLTGSLTDHIVANAKNHPERVAFSRQGGAGWQPVSSVAFHEQVRRIAKGLIAAGVEPGDRVALLSRTRYEWTLVDYALWYVGAVAVPIYETSSAAQVEWLLTDSGATGIFVESAEHRARLDPAQPPPPCLRHVWTLDDGALDDLEDAGTGISDRELDRRREAVTPTSVATVIYTSGTTDHPRGCSLTHGNFMFEVDAALSALAGLFERRDSSTLLFLPLAHVFARVIQVGAVKAGVRLGHAPDVKTLASELSTFEPTFLLAVPRVFEKLFNDASQDARINGRGGAFDKAVATAIAYSKALEEGGPGLLLRTRHALVDKLVYTRIRRALGGQCTQAISGGAPLGRTSRPLLPRSRSADPRGLRAHRDDSSRHGEPAGAGPGRQRRPAAGRHDRARGRRRRAAGSRPAGHAWVLGEPPGVRRGAFPGGLAPHGRPGGDRRRGFRVDHRTQEGLLVTAGGRTSHRHHWRSGSAHIPWSASAWCWETGDRSSARWSLWSAAAPVGRDSWQDGRAGFPGR